MTAFTSMVQMRAELIDGDSSVILSLLMRFPDMEVKAFIEKNKNKQNMENKNKN